LSKRWGIQEGGGVMKFSTKYTETEGNGNWEQEDQQRVKLRWKWKYRICVDMGCSVPMSVCCGLVN
jgi:hypothetical protein